MASLINLGLSAAKPALTLRTQITPDLRIDLSEDAQPAPPRQPGPASIVVEWMMTNVLRPEIEVELPGGIVRKYSPWGTPTKQMAAMVGLVTVAALGSSAIVGWQMYKKYKS
jgi:hypothetical protein